MEFAELTLEQKLKLKDLTIDRAFITKDEMEQVKTILAIHGVTDIALLRAVRNSVVKFYHEELERYMDSNFKIGLQIMANMSGVTATIDNMIYRLGGEV